MLQCCSADKLTLDKITLADFSKGFHCSEFCVQFKFTQLEESLTEPRYTGSILKFFLRIFIKIETNTSSRVSVDSTMLCKP